MATSDGSTDYLRLESVESVVEFQIETEARPEARRCIATIERMLEDAGYLAGTFPTFNLVTDIMNGEVPGAEAVGVELPNGEIPLAVDVYSAIDTEGEARWFGPEEDIYAPQAAGSGPSALTSGMASCTPLGDQTGMVTLIWSTTHEAIGLEWPLFVDLVMAVEMPQESRSTGPLIAPPSGEPSPSEGGGLLQPAPRQDAAPDDAQAGSSEAGASSAPAGSVASCPDDAVALRDQYRSLAEGARQLAESTTDAEDRAALAEQAVQLDAAADALDAC